jgi:hypothetical protein
LSINLTHTSLVLRMGWVYRAEKQLTSCLAIKGPRNTTNRGEGMKGKEERGWEAEGKAEDHGETAKLRANVVCWVEL